ncbi:helicase, type I site-specific restriction-modification system restriction subunit [Frankia casuarinae]|uniref:Type I restriction enzyme endonuclease subunit n=1 Tax=Frankia casuarinae (strain DSM 45818 / CECT 9043 / HFP020203 / CcI3) TaxID=106370 RepID=Q2J5T1_FRACC|nr:type I restriction endonuclease subunit R [Frankia casuarinae]ABD13361.1 type I site-specific deoxyribonuclease, HsdR family [Frankia casuarinae]EYT89769.1 helicase, type I site-specific restriction-modification system restriction subunit [Frankia casuarinae]
MTGAAEFELVERPLVDQLRGLGWAYLAGTKHAPAASGRASFSEVLLEGRLHAALRRINPGPDGELWLDDGRLAQAVAALTRPKATRLVEINEELTEALLLGVPVEGIPEVDGGRNRRVRFIDWDTPSNNDFLVVNQFRVDIPGSQGRRYIEPDIVLFVNGIPLVVVEAKSPTTSSPVAKAIRQLARYADQRGAVTREGNERLFYTNQFVVATSWDEAKVGTFTSDPDHFAEWKTTEPTPETEVAEALGVDGLTSQQRLVAGMLAPERLLDIVRHFTLFMPAQAGRTMKIVARYQQYRAVRRTIHRLSTGKTRVADGEFDRRGGIIWHTQGSGKSLTMVFLIRVMRTHPDLVGFKVVVVTDRRDLQDQLAKTAELTGETPRTARNVQQVRSLLSVPGKALLFAMIQKYRNPDAAKDAPLEVKSLGVLDPSEGVVVLVDEAHRSHSSTLHSVLLDALPNAARIGFTGTPIIMGKRKRTHAIFGPYLDRYTISESEADGATVPIRYEGRTTKSDVQDSADLDELFEDMFPDLTDAQLAKIRRRWGTIGNVLEAEKMITAKARDMLRHYVDTALPGGFKAQIVATSRLAAVRYRDALLAARDDLVARLDALPAELRTPEAADRATSPEGIPGLGRARLRDVRAWPYRDLIARLDFVPVISGEQNEKDWRDWIDETRQKVVIEEFKKPLPAPDDPAPDPATTSTVAFLLVKSMLLTGFDAAVDQVIYLDRRIKEAELLQAIARVNRTARGKANGYVVDYFGVAKHLHAALEAYAAEDIDGALASITDELPLLADRHARVRALFTDRGQERFDTPADQEACVQILADDALRAAFQVAYRALTRSLETVLPRPEALPYAADTKAFGVIGLLARRRYDRDDPDFDVSVYGEKVRRLIDDHIVALGISQKIPPVSLTDARFDEKVGGLTSKRAKASEMEHALRHHISGMLDADPVRARTLSQQLSEILDRLRDQWDQLVAELGDLIDKARAGRTTAEDPDDAPDGVQLTPIERLFFDILRAERVAEGKEMTPVAIEAVAELVTFIVDHLCREIGRVHFWGNAHAQQRLHSWITVAVSDVSIDGDDLFDQDRAEAIADQIVELARHNHAAVVTTVPPTVS